MPVTGSRIPVEEGYTLYGMLPSQTQTQTQTQTPQKCPFTENAFQE